MPVYEYHCDQCRKSFSLLLKMSAGEETMPCPTCGNPAKKQVSGCAIGSSGEGPSCVPSGGG